MTPESGRGAVPSDPAGAGCSRDRRSAVRASRTVGVVGIAALAVPLAALVAALAVGLAADHRTVARVGLHAEATEVSVDCGARGGASRDVWGEAASRRCEPILGSHLARTGAIAAVGGAIGWALAVVARRRRIRVRVARILGGTLLAIGIPVALLGLLSDLSPAAVVGLVADDGAVLDALGRDDVVASFEVLELRATRFGLRVNEERWVVLGADLADVRTALDRLGWAMADVPERFDDGWVAARATAAPDVVEAGTFAAVTSDRADTGRNARRLLEDVDAAPDLVVVHVRPPELAGPGRSFEG